MKYILPLVASVAICALPVKAGIAIVNSTPLVIPVNVTHTVQTNVPGTSSYLFATNEVATTNLPSGGGLSAGGAYNLAAAIHTLTVQIGSYSVTGTNINVNGGSQTFTNGSDVVVLSMNSSGNMYATGTPTLTFIHTNSGGVNVYVNSKTSPPQNNGAVGNNASTCGGVCSGGPMAAYSFNTMLNSLSVSDVPIKYSPPVGPDIAFQLAYNQKDNTPTNFSFSNLGPKWNFSAISYIQDDTTQQAANVTCYPQGGGFQIFSGINTNTGVFPVELYSQSKLTRTATNSYTQLFSDGSQLIYGFADSGTTNRRVFLTKSIDPASNVVNYVYQSGTNGVRLVQVIDAIGQTNTFNYGVTNDSLKISAITDPFGRTAYLGYVQTNGALRLASITDPIQIVSKFAYTNDFLNALNTPYGTTKFNYSTNAGQQVLTATDPYGQTECLQYREQDIVPGEASYPTNMILDTGRIGYRNSYYWNKRAWALYPNDLTKAVITHWATLNGQTIDAPLYVKSPLEGSIWFNYPGQTSAWGDGITTTQPNVVARVLDDGSIQTITASYDGWGNLTNSVDAKGRTSSFAYSSNGIDLLTIRQQGDLIASFTYNSLHLPVFAAINGVTNWISYNTNGQILRVTNACFFTDHSG